MIKKFAERNNDVNEAKMPTVSKELMKATEKMHAEQLKQQELQKKFVSEMDPDKKEKMKADLVAQHKKVKEAERNFQEALGREEVDYDDSLLEDMDLSVDIFTDPDSAKNAVRNVLIEISEELADDIDDLLSYLEQLMEENDEYLSPNAKKEINAVLTHYMQGNVSLVKAIAALKK